MSKIHFLPVKYGDSFVIECQQGDNKGIVVVDGGPTGCGFVLQNKIKELGFPDLTLRAHNRSNRCRGYKEDENEVNQHDSVSP